MAFTTFDLSTAEFPDSGFSGSYVDGSLVPDQPGLGMIFWIPGMTRNLTSWYTLVLDFEVQGDSPYSARPKANAFQWRNDGDYASSSGSNLRGGDTGIKAVQSLVIQIEPGGDADEERVGIFTFANVPPVTGVRWQESSPSTATGTDFTTAQDFAFGQVYAADWSTMSAPTAENTALSTPDVLAAVWFKFTMPTAGMIQFDRAPGGSIYSGTSLASLTYVADANSVPTLSAGAYYARITATTGTGTAFTSDVSAFGWKSATIFGPWTTPNPSHAEFTLNIDGTTTAPTGLSDLAFNTQQGVDGGQGGRVGTWDSFTDSSGNASAPPFNFSDLQAVINSAESANPGTFLSTPAAAGWRIVNQAFTDGVGGTNGHRDYQAGDARVAWFVGLSVPVSPPVDSLATGWENEDGSSDTVPDALATTGELAATFAHLNATDDGGAFTTGTWATHFASVEGATLNVDGNVDYDVIAHAGTVLFDFARDSDNDTEDKTASITMPEGDTFGFVQWTTAPVGISEAETGRVGTHLFDGTFTVAYQPPDFRERFEGIEVLLPLSGEVVSTVIPPLRQYPRSDGLGASSVRRLWPPPPTIQASNRRGPSAIL